MTSLSERATVRLEPARGVAAISSIAVLVDTALIFPIVMVASLARRELPIFENVADVSGQIVMVGPAVVLAWIAALALGGGYRVDIFGASTEEYKRVLNASLLSAAVLGVGCYLANYPLSRGFFVLIFAIGTPALLLGRYLLRRGIHSARRRGALLQRVVIVGSISHIDEIAGVLLRDPTMGYDVLGALTPATDLTEETGTGVPVLGNADDVVAIAQDAGVDAILFAGGGLSSGQRLREIVWELEHGDFNVVVAPSVTEISGERITVRPIGGMPLMHIEKPTWVGAARLSKRLFDLGGAIAILVLSSPLLIVCTLRVRAYDRGPVFFRQTRIGRNGQQFACFKFRTMVTDAEARLGSLRAVTDTDGRLFKMKDDPRVTRPGRWMRRYSLDELPQLLNVIRGEMSLVGPRPPLPTEVADYVDQTARRLRVRPGMTGLWQVSGRSDLSFEEAVRLDLYYVDNWSMLQDLSILSRTAGAVLSSRGAY